MGCVDGLRSRDSSPGTEGDDDEVNCCLHRLPRRYSIPSGWEAGEGQRRRQKCVGLLSQPVAVVRFNFGRPGTREPGAHRPVPIFLMLKRRIILARKQDKIGE